MEYIQHWLQKGLDMPTKIDYNEIKDLSQEDLLSALDPSTIEPAQDTQDMQNVPIGKDLQIGKVSKTTQTKQTTQSSQDLSKDKIGEYFTIPLGRRNIAIRKWKVKDRITLKKTFQTQDPDKQAETTLKILVWNCLQEKIALNQEELEYLFAMLRVYSIGDSVEFKYTCTNPDCGKLVSEKVKISQIWRPKFSDLHNIGGIEIGEVKNSQFYNKRMREMQYSTLEDLILHITAIDGKEYSETELLEHFENMDISEADGILEQWEAMAFSLDKMNTLICPYCRTENEFEFDEIPELIPPVWFKR